MPIKHSTAALIVLMMIGCARTGAPRPHNLEEVLASGRDIWGEAALHEPDGPSYEYFEKLLPPLRYVEASFRVYPIVLSAPGAPVKARLLGDGSAINALARQPNWAGETGIPITFRVGMDRKIFGSDPTALVGLKYLDGYLPVVQTQFRSGDAVYAQEVFADLDPESARSGLAFVRFTLLEGNSGKLEVQIEGTTPQKVIGNQPLPGFYKFDPPLTDNWRFNAFRNTLTTPLKIGESAELAISTDASPRPVDRVKYELRRKACIRTWNTLLADGTIIHVPEPVVNDAWRASLIGSYMLLKDNDIRYSHGNQYAKLYIGEGGDAVRSFALFGHASDANRMITPLFTYTRKALEFHQAAFKLQMLAHCYKLSRDRNLLEQTRSLWEKELAVILSGREKATGMLPREKYCGDIETMVYSLNSNSNCWRALRDMSILLDEIGEKDRAAEIAKTANDYRAVILKSLDKAIRRDISPPFVPIALSGEEEPYDFIPGVRMGGYWNIMMQYVVGSGVFPPDSETADSVMQYMQQRGGLVMGMLSTHADTQNYWMASRKINDLYGMRYAQLLLRRDEPDRALVSFYGKLAQGFTRDTFIGSEGSDIKPLDEFGRLMYLPPNSAGNASFLQQLRYLLVQDYDLDDDGREETLRLMFATPRRWMRDGERISVTKAPTAFGEVSFVAESHLDEGSVEVDVSLPERSPAKTLLRLRLPDGNRVVSATAGEQSLKFDSPETLDLSGLSGNQQIRAVVAKGAR